MHICTHAGSAGELWRRQAAESVMSRVASWTVYVCSSSTGLSISILLPQHSLTSACSSHLWPADLMSYLGLPLGMVVFVATQRPSTAPRFPAPPIGSGTSWSSTAKVSRSGFLVLSTHSFHSTPPPFIPSHQLLAMRLVGKHIEKDGSVGFFPYKAGVLGWQTRTIGVRRFPPSFQTWSIAWRPRGVRYVSPTRLPPRLFNTKARYR
jgi:hypothetical protein